MPRDDLLNQALRAGMAALQKGDWGAASESGHTAVTLAPDHPGGYHLLGLALLQQGELTIAIPALEKAAHLDRNNAGLLGNLAHAYAITGRHDDAHRTYRRAHRLAPAQWQYEQGAAVALAQSGDAASAEPLLRRLVQRYPQQALPRYNLGNVLLELDRLQEAEDSYRAALRLAPDDLDIRLSLGSSLHRQCRFTDAEAVYRDCITAQPAWTAPRLNLVSALIDDGRFGDAELECAALIEYAPDLTEAHRFLGAACGQQGKMVQSVAAYREAVRCAPEDATAQRSLGGALAECGELHEALRIIAKAEMLAPDDPGLQQLLSMTFLAHGIYADGWSAYRSRPAYLRHSREWTDAGVTQTLPADLSQKRVLVRREQGLGDELFFLRQLPELRERGAHITVRVSEKLSGMIRRTGVADAVIPDTAPLQDEFEVQILCGDLPHALHSCPSSLRPHHAEPCTVRDYPALIHAYHPLPVPSLRIPALPEAIERMRVQLRQLGSPPYIGITWRAGIAANQQIGADWVLNKMIPLSALGEALRSCPGTLIALQRQPAPGDIKTLGQSCARAISDLTAVNESLEDMLALLHLLDDYVGVSNTNMHLRAAAGRSARVLIPCPADWRWMHWGARSPWFPDFPLYRQTMQGDWMPALRLLARDLVSAF